MSQIRSDDLRPRNDPDHVTDWRFRQPLSSGVFFFSKHYCRLRVAAKLSNLRSQGNVGIVSQHLAREFALAHAIRLVGWPKHEEFFFFSLNQSGCALYMHTLASDCIHVSSLIQYLLLSRTQSTLTRLFQLKQQVTGQIEVFHISIVNFSQHTLEMPNVFMTEEGNSTP